MKFPNARIIIFAKAPVEGKCKTRLIPALGAQGAAQLHGQLIHHTLVTTTQSQLAPVELWCTDNPTNPFIQHCGQQFSVAIKQQHGADLGERMFNAFEQTLRAAPFALLIGTDCPSLSTDDLQAAMQALHEGALCTLHPAHDGGYVAIGLSQANKQLFSDIHWGSDNVFLETQKCLERLNWRWQCLAKHHDIDRPEDLIYLQQITLNT